MPSNCSLVCAYSPLVDTIIRPPWFIKSCVMYAIRKGDRAFVWKVISNPSSVKVAGESFAFNTAAFKQSTSIPLDSHNVASNVSFSTLLSCFIKDWTESSDV